MKVNKEELDFEKYLKQVFKKDPKVRIMFEKRLKKMLGPLKAKKILLKYK